jgi:hypothetical protein
VAEHRHTATARHSREFGREFGQGVGRCTLTSIRLGERPGDDELAHKPQVLVIDDQPHLVGRWLEQVFPDFRFLLVSNLTELTMLLDGKVIERLLPGPYDPIAALVDLHLGPTGQGVSAVHALTRSRLTRDTTPILFTNGLGAKDDRDLHAVLCAYASAGGSGILAASKDERDSARLGAVFGIIAQARRAGVRHKFHDRVTGLEHILPVRFVSRFARPEESSVDLIKILLGSSALRDFWHFYALSNQSLSLAYEQAFDANPSATQKLTERDRAVRAGGRGRPNWAELLNQSDLGDLPLAWAETKSFLAMDRYLTLPNEVDSSAAGRQQRTVAFAQFAERYGDLLAHAQIHEFARNHLATRLIG